MVLKEDKRFVAFTPALDLSTSATTYEKAKKRFEEIVSIFFEEIISKGTFNEVLKDLGWKKVDRKWQPPVVVSHQTETVCIPSPT